MTYHLAVDLGATSGRTMLSCYDGEQIQMREFSRFQNPQIPIQGHVYWDLPGLYNQILEALRKVAREGITLTSIGIDTWGVDVAFFAKDGRLLGLPHCYRDNHTDGAVERFFEDRMPREQLYQKTGIQFMPFNTLFQLDTLQREGCATLQEADKIMFIPDALSYMLTGNCVCEYTVASTSQMLDARTGDFDTRLLELLGLRRDQFGDMVQPGHQIGILTQQIQEYTGVGPVPVIAVAGHDTASAVLAVPATEKDYTYLSCGTWSLLGTMSETPIINDESLKENFTNEGGTEGKIRFLKNICGLWVFENCRKEWGDAVPQNVNELNALSQQSNYQETINPDDPAFAHPASMVTAIDEYMKQHGKPVPQSHADYVRCIFHSLACRIHSVLDILDNMRGGKTKCLHVIGGGSLNVYLMQMLATELGIPVVTGPAEGTALGNTMIQVGINNYTKTQTKTYLP